jgi:uncharacterized protein (TIGR02246 family)
MKSRFSRSALLLLVLLGFGGGSAAVRASDPAADRAAIEAASRQFSAAYMRGEAAVMASLYTPEGVIFPNNSEAITGREAIQRYWTLVPGHRVMNHKATPTEIRILGDHAYDYGIFEISGERDGKPYGPFVGKYVIVWRREPEGWRMHLDMWNSKPQPKP